MNAVNSLSDIELIGLLKKDNEHAYAEIFDRYNSLLYAHAYRKLNNRDDAKDLIQDVFANLWIKRHRLEINSSLTAYLFTAVRNKFYDMLSHKNIEDNYIKSLQDFFKSEQSTTDHLVREKEFLSIIEEEIKSLPPRMRLVFEKSRKNHLSHKEIALELGISEQTVTDQIKKALKILKPRLLPVIFLILSSKMGR